MPTESITIYGSGGHAKVVLDAVRTGGAFGEIRVVDDDPVRQGSEFFGLVIESADNLEDGLGAVHLAIGDNERRARQGDRVLSAGAELCTVRHPGSLVSGLAVVERGCFIAAGATVAAAAEVLVGSIINHSAVVDHDCAVGAWVHLAPGAVLGGAVSVGEGALIGSGSIILPGVTIGAWSVVGAGAVVTKDVESGSVVVGTPARKRI